jgi:hypothetical protein
MPGALRFNIGGSTADHLYRTTNLPSASAFTIMAWARVRVSAVSPNFNTFIRAGVNGAGNMVLIGEAGGRLVIYNGAGNNGSTFLLGQWVHVALTQSALTGTTLLGYLNGVLDISAAALSFTLGSLSLGNSFTNDPLDGDIGPFKAFSRVLGPEEIAAEMMYALPVNTQGCISCLPWPRHWESLDAFGFLSSDRSNVLDPYTDWSGQQSDWTQAGTIVPEIGPPVRWAPPVRLVTYRGVKTPAAVGGTTYSYTMAGGLSSGGVSPASVKKVPRPAGGLQSGGAALAFGRRVVVAAGGLQSGGASTVFVRRVVVPIGGVQSGGLAPLRRTMILYPSGGLQSGGLAPAWHRMVLYPAGGVVSGGGALSAKFQIHVPSGGLLTGGHAQARILFVPRPAGGLQSSGAGIVVLKKRIIAAGGLISGGVASTQFARVHIVTGGVSSGGASAITMRYAPHPTGGLVSGGAAFVTFRGVYVFVGSGGLQSSGAAHVSRRFAPPVPIGGVVTGGLVPAVKRYGYTGGGGFTSAGAALLRAIRSSVGVGGVQSGGAASSQYIFGGTIPAAFMGRVFIFPHFTGRVAAMPQLDGRITIDPDR